MNKTQKPVEEISEIKAELLAMTGSTAGYNALMEDIERQMRAIVQVRGQWDLKTGKFIPPQVPGRKRPARRTNPNP